MTQDMNHTYMKALRAVIVVAMMSLTGSHALAGVRVTGNVYGGGNDADVQTNTVVNISAGQIDGNVYGGGNLGDVGQSVTVNISSGEVQGDVYGGGALANTNTANWDASANDGAGGWATGKYNETTHTTTYTTSVNLTGGLIKGDAYGGGLGQKTGFNGAESDKAAVVYGDIAVTLNGTAFEITKYTDEGYTDVVKSGRVFGCNNLLGSPKGNVTVTVYKTVSLDADGNIKNKPTKNTTYELADVYGGGNLAPYTTTGKKTHVIIHGCSDTSIETVYGGGNAAAVPETQVDVYSAYEIRALFGGGNGKDKFKNDEGWQTNPGADINGDTNTMIYGGTVHEAYGGSNEKGTITGNVAIDVAGTNPDVCPLVVDKLVGAGKNADVNGDLIMILGCKPSNKIDILYAGADNANVKGNVELTITSGNFGKVFGGNNAGGAIFGHIKLNIEETGECGTPITIDELYLGGNEAAYSQYGYYNSGTAEAPVYKPRSSADDENAAVGHPAVDATHTFPFVQPELNVISCTYIGKVYGGGFGTGAKLYGNPIVNINMIQGNHANDVHTFMANDDRLTGLSLPSTDNPNNLGVIGDVYGGGNAADVVGDPTVNIGTETTVTLTSIEDDPNTTEVNESQKTVLGAYIIGNVFGGGMGDDDSFFCDKAMIGKDGDGVDNPNGGPTVNIYKGTVRGNVYGGGEIGRVEKNTVVTIGAGDGTANGTPSPVIMGSVFGGGKGKETHGYAALVRGNPTVTIQGNASVGHSVYGGGEIASVARYKVPKTEDDVTAAHAAGYTDAVLGMPYALADPDHPSGICTVIVKGYAKIGPDGMQMTKTGGPDDTGYVFGAGRGILPGGTYKYQRGSTRRMVLYDDKVHTNVGQTGSKWQWVDPDHSETNKNVWEYFDDLDEYIRFIQTLALSSYTHVTIDGNALVKGSVYGGSENGIVQFDTDVKIQGGQIGVAASGSAECASWTYKAPYAPYDPYAIYKNPSDNKYYYNQAYTQYAEGGASVATDGHTYYGNVFGGGSGSVPYFDSTLGQSVYLHSAGQVKGDTHVTITDGHILTNVYGGCEATNVTGSAYVTMKGGTIGVERTDEQIIAHPLTGYLFGAGKGDQRVFFNKDTNVKDAIVIVEGGRIYGSVYGGGEDGHVLRNTTVTIKETDATNHPTKIGTRGTSYYDGNVFGGGRGFGGEALTAGNVGGGVTLNIEAGEILGSVYGGGRMASVGYGLYLVDEEINGVKPYGIMRPDNEYDGSYTNPSTEAAGTFFTLGRGKITVNVSGGTIGNDVTDAEYGGNVFGGSMGRLTKLDGSAFDTANHWSLLATVKKATVNVTGGIIKRSVYGGGELGTVTTDAIVTVSGGTIGTSGNGGVEFGNVYGGGKGYVDPAGSNYITAGIIKGNTTVTINPSTTIEGEPSIYHNIYGGGAYGSVGTFTYDEDDENTIPDGTITGYTSGGTTYVTITGGTIGTTGQNNGMVFGSSRGNVGAPGEIHDRLAWVYDTHVTIGDADSGPAIKGSIYGSGENGHTYHDTEVIIHNGKIGIDSNSDPGYTVTSNSQQYSGADYPYRGNVYGGGCGTDKYYSDPDHLPDNHTLTDGEGDTYNYLAGIVLGNATVTIDGGTVVRNVYGAGAMGSVGTITNFDNLDVQDANNNYLYKHVDTNDDGAFCDFGLSWPYKFVYSKGTDNKPNSGLARVTIKGTAIIGGHVFGAARGAVDVGTNDITEQRYVEAKLANVREAQVTIGIENGTTTTPTIHGSVYGGGEDGHVNENATVTIYHGRIDHSVFGGGKGESTFKTKLYDPAITTIPTLKTYTDPKGEPVHSWTAGRVYGSTTITMNGGSVGYNMYGGGNLASVGIGNYAGGSDDYSTAGYGELPPKSAQALWTNTDFMGSNLAQPTGGLATVTINGGKVGVQADGTTHTGTDTNGDPYGNVFGGSRGKAAMNVGQLSPRYRYVPDFFLGYVNQTAVTIGDGTKTPVIFGSVYGGGQDGHVRRSTKVILNKSTIGHTDGGHSEELQKEIGNVYGAGSGLGQYNLGTEANPDMYYNNSSGSVTCTTTVEVNNGANILGNVYGGGALSSVGPPFTGQTIGIETNSNSTTDTKKSVSFTQVDIKGGSISGNVYGSSRGGLDLNYNGEDPNTYATNLWSTVNVIDGEISGSVYGGGEAGQVKGSIEVNITGGTINKDVYGGGALAHTNTSNWVYNRQTDTTPGSWGTTWATGMVDADGKTKYNTAVNLYGGMIKGDAYGGGLGRLEAGTSGQPGYVAPIEAKVYGDVSVNQGMVNDESKITAYTITYLTTDELQKDDNGNDIEGQYVKVVNSGRIFGCNNLNGSPQGNVTVTVNGTTTGKDGNGNNLTRTAIERDATTKEITSVATPHVYEVAAVYGGGNLADYTPAEGVVKVIVNSCNVSVEEVYGGGNAAEVPATDVLVNGAHEIEQVFGGGNGQDKYTLDRTTWIVNPGANVNGDTKTILKGGLIHEAYGGSNEKGTITGDIFIDTEDGGLTDCPLLLEKMVGAGKNADVNGNLIVVMGCKPSQKTPVFYAGADDANVKGNVELTITSGNYGKVFGGNNEGGAIMGHIIVNIEETGECSTPITIDELYLGGNNAAYSIYGYYVKTNETEAENGNGTGATTEHAILKNGKLQFMPRQSATDTHLPVKEYSYDESGVPSWTTSPITGEGAFKPYAEPELNVVSCTRIDQVYGGGYGTGGTMYANPTVNINMIKGSFAENETKGVPAVMTAKGIDDSDNPQKLGIIGDVFGGGNAAVVMGNPTVNIGTATEVILHLSYDKTTIDETHDGYTYSGDPQTVLGAYIHGNIYGGGNLADVGYLDDDTKVNDPNSVYCNTNVNICAKEVTVESEKVWQSVAVGSGEVTITGHVFGGGKGKNNTFKCEKAMIVGNTNVRIGNGTMKGDVYGGGEIGRVEQNTAVTIGLTSGTSAPVINGNVFGAGAGRATHGYSALVRGNSTVMVQAGTKVGGSVYGGGEVATAGRYRIENDLPVETTSGGLCTVTVQGDAEITGNVFGAGQGVTPAYDQNNYKNFKSMVTAINKPDGDENDTWDYYVDENNQKDEHFVWKYYKTEADYLKFLQTLALASNTVVTIDGDAKVKKNVYGGSESGFVQDHTQVTTLGSCVIGTSTTTGENTTYTDGNVFGGGKGLASFAEAGIVKGTTTLLINNGTMYGNVYGGGELGSVGTYKISPDMRSFYWTNTPLADIDPEDATTYTYNNTGVCNVNIAGGTIGYTGVAMASDGSFANGNVFGAGKGLEDTFWCEKAIVYKANVSVTAGTVNGNVYGGGEVGRVETDAVVKIGPDEGTSTPDIKGNVFGGGAGVKTHGYSALVRGNTYVTVQSSAQVGHNVYGGGQIAAVGKYYLVDAAYKEAHPESNLEIGMPYSLVSDKLGICNVTVIGSAAITGNVFGGGKGKEPENYTFADNANRPKRMMSYNTALFTDNNHAIWEFADANEKYVWEYFDTKPKYQTFLETLGLTTQSKVTIGGTRNNDDTVTPSGSPTINGNVYGGSESGFVQHNTFVTIAGGTIGTTSTGGDIFGGGLGLATFAEAGRVRGNTNVTINAGTESGKPMIYHNVYGGGQLGDVGTIVKSADYNYKWTDEANPSATYTWNNTGVCNVTINGGTIGTGVDPSADGTYANGNVYGAGKGLEDTWWCEKAIAYKTNVTVTDGLIKGTVYGGGQLGRVENDATVTIGTEDEEGTSNKPNIIGNVFGAGAGVKTHGYSALVRGNSNLTVQGIALVGGSVYGGGEIASVGRFTVVGGLPKHPDSGGTCNVTIKGHAKIGASGTGHNVFGACKGVTPAFDSSDLTKNRSFQTESNRPKYANGTVKEEDTYWNYVKTYPTGYEGTKFVWVYYRTEPEYLDFLETLALTSHPIVTIAEDATVNGSVFGGGERGITLGSVGVNMNGGTVTQDVYGGGSLANTNKGNWDGTDWASGKVVNGKTEYTTTVNLHSGTINQNVYGGGLGDANTAALVYGDVLVKLNETIASDDCVVKGNIFGCNNVNGTPKGDVTVHVYKTVTKVNGKIQAKPTKNDTNYELAAVYGGGNQAAYDPEDANATRSTNVIIDGCALTSIETVYGGGNAASAPGTNVTVNSCYEIGTVFAGGNGKDALAGGVENPGADVGYKLNAEGTDKVSYGSGKSYAELKGGTIHKAFGGSNSKGNVRTSATVDLNEPDPNDCPLCIDEVYGAGNEAYQDGTSNINLGCISFLNEIYGGSKNADINNSIDLTIQSGRFNRVFGGNNLGGAINGTITVNIEETGCHPIVIGQLFGGGNQAAYTAPTGQNGPTVNVKSFTSIGEIYGGGFGGSAIVTGDTYVNVNECKGKYADRTATVDFTDQNGVDVYENNVRVKVSENTGQWIHFQTDPDNQNQIATVWQPEHREGAIGTIGNVFGGGNEAPVDGSTHINIGNMEYVKITTNIVVGETDVRDFYTRSGDGTSGDPYVYSEVSVKAVANTTYYQLVVGEGGTKTYTALDNIEVGVTDISNYYVRTGGEGTEGSPYVYSKAIAAQANTTYYRNVLGVNITGNVYGGGNAADVTGDTNVFIGKDQPTTTP